jgi:hypothetical protein
MGPINLKVVWTEKEERFWQRLILPEEDRRLYTSAPWKGGYRWFRSPNIVPLEKYRRVKPVEGGQKVA